MIFIGLGANLPSQYGTPAETLERAKEVFSDYDMNIIKSSRTYLSAPVPVSDSPWYANAVVSISTPLSSNDLLYRLNDIEAKFGRVRTYRNAPRVLDLDIIAYEHEVIGEDGDFLCLPHPRMHDRAFVLKPLLELSSNWVHPKTKQSIEQLICEGEATQALVFEQTVPLKAGEEYRVAG